MKCAACHSDMELNRGGSSWVCECGYWTQEYGFFHLYGQKPGENLRPLDVQCPQQRDAAIATAEHVFDGDGGYELLMVIDMIQRDNDNFVLHALKASPDVAVRC